MSLQHNTFSVAASGYSSIHFKFLNSSFNLPPSHLVGVSKHGYVCEREREKEKEMERDVIQSVNLELKFD